MSDEKSIGDSIEAKREKVSEVSKPPPGKKRIKNIYWDPLTNEMVFDIED